MKDWLVANAQRRLPAGSRARAIARIAWGTLRDTRRVVGVTKHALATEIPGRQRDLTYSEWRRSHTRAPATDQSAVEQTTFTVVIRAIPGAEGEAYRRTARSVLAQTVPDIVTMTHRDGANIHDLLEDVDTDFVVFVREGAVLHPSALDLVAKKHRVDPSLRLIYFDSDVIDARKRTSPLFRPEFSPEMLLGQNYLGSAFAIAPSYARRSAEASLDDQGLWRLLLDMDAREREVGNIPEVLLSEPLDHRSVAGPDDADMVRAALGERGEIASTSIRDGVVRVKFEPPQWPSVSVVIPTRHSRTNLERLLPGLASTDYPGFDVTIVDNGDETAENREWYSEWAARLPVNVIWWTESPFNYSRVNNAGVATTAGEVVVMLNDDTEIVDAGWLRELVGMLVRDGVGTVGYRHLRADGSIQHGGVTVGPGGFADNLFAGLRPGDDTLLGSTDWYRNALAVTGACVAIRRSDFDTVHGLDERFILCGSDVVLGLDQIIAGRRNVVIPFDAVRHYESVTRGTAIPMEDFHASYWRYNPWLRNGDPYSSPNVSRLSAIPRFARLDEDPPVKIALGILGRPYGSVAQSSSISEEATALMRVASVSRQEVEAVRATHEQNAAPFAVSTVNWFIPDIDMPFFGGLNTAFRIADKLVRDHGVVNRFVVLAAPNELFLSSAIAAAFPRLAGSEIVFYDGQDESIAAIPPADIAIATLWLTADHVARAPGVRRRFYLVQDYEPAFYPASTMFAMAEESYRLGLYGICNTASMHRIYTEGYSGKATWFAPAVDRGVYHADGRREKSNDEPVTIFAYARDHFRNCWELVYAALAEVKRRHGTSVRIVAAGARYLPSTADFIDLGLLDYRATGRLYRETDIGITMQISRHPSYLPLELMASGVAMVAPDSDWFTWLFVDGENAQLSMRTFDDVVAKLESLIEDAALRRRTSELALATIATAHDDWDDALSGIYEYLCDPEAP